jgi:glutamyl-tRNA synthetase
MSQRPVRVRFAPSPTGFLHIGGVRAALYNWLYARHHGGKFLLRIEDTDVERSEQRFTDDILASMKWLGLTWDEEPIFQSKRMDHYHAIAEKLIELGHAYRCTCTEAELAAMREKAEKEGKKPKYNGKCREKKHKAEGSFVVRAKLPEDGYVEFLDLIRGTIRVQNEELDDFVIIRSNNAPTYNFTVVIDDTESDISHVIRGDDHINNTPKQLHLYKALGRPQPAFAHLPMILGSDKKKLSKRHGAVSANVYRADGFLPEAMLNFLARIGWSHGDQEVFSVQEMIQYFEFDHVQRSSGVFNTEKLLWLNGEHIRRSTPARLAAVVADDFSHHFAGPSLERLSTQLGEQLVTLVQPKVKTLKELAEQLVPLCTPGAVEVDPSGLKWGKDEGTKAAVKAAVKVAHAEWGEKIKAHALKNRTGADQAWGDQPCLHDLGMSAQDIDQYLRALGERHGVKLGDLAQPMRLVVTGRLVSAGLFELLALLPWDVIGPRLAKVESLP